MSDVSAVIFAKDRPKLVRFYSEALGFKRTAGDDDHSVLSSGGFDLVVHQIPSENLNDVAVSKASSRRESGSIRLDFAVDSIDEARSLAARLGGRVDGRPPAWALPDTKFFLGHDPEGNVFGLSERAG